MKELSSTGRMLPVSTARRGDTSFVLFENHLNMVKLITKVYTAKKSEINISLRVQYIKGTVSWDRFQKYWQKFTELGLTKGHGWFLTFFGTTIVLHSYVQIFYRTPAGYTTDRKTRRKRNMGCCVLLSVVSSPPPSPRPPPLHPCTPFHLPVAMFIRIRRTEESPPPPFTAYPIDSSEAAAADIEDGL